MRASGNGAGDTWSDAEASDLGAGGPAKGSSGPATTGIAALDVDGMYG